MQSKFFHSVSHAKGLSTKITSHQVQTVAEEIHLAASEVVLPLADGDPKYVAIAQMLDQLRGSIDQLELAHNHRRFKAVREMRGVGGVDGKDTEVSLSRIKRGSANERAKQMRQFRRMVSWHIEAGGTFLEQAEILNEILAQRIKSFETLGYQESQPEFKYFFDAMNNDQAALTAISAIGLDNVYARMRSEHEAIKDIYREQTMLESKREEKPKIRPSDRDVRHAVRMLLSTMHYDVEAGNPQFLEVLGQIDEMIDRAKALGVRRKTIAQKKAREAEIDTQQSAQVDTHSESNDELNDATDSIASEDADVATDADASNTQAAEEAS